MIPNGKLGMNKSHTYFSPVEKSIESIIIHSFDLLPPALEEEEEEREEDEWCEEEVIDEENDE